MLALKIPGSGAESQIYQWATKYNAKWHVEAKWLYFVQGRDPTGHTPLFIIITS